MARLSSWNLLVLLCCAAVAGGCGRMRFEQIWLPLPTAEPTVVGGGNARLEMARMSERLGRTDLAKQFYRDVLAKDPTSQQAHHRLAVLAVQEKRWRVAAAHFDRAYELGPRSAELLNDLAYAFYQRRQWAHAERALRRALDLEPDNPQARSLLALTLGEQGRHQESLAAFRQVLQRAERGTSPEGDYHPTSIAARPHKPGRSFDRTQTQFAAAGVARPGPRRSRAIETPEPEEMVALRTPWKDPSPVKRLPPSYAAEPRVVVEEASEEIITVEVARQTPSGKRASAAAGKERLAEANAPRRPMSNVPRSKPAETAEDPDYRVVTVMPTARSLSRLPRPAQPLRGVLSLTKRNELRISKPAAPRAPRKKPPAKRSFPEGMATFVAPLTRRGQRVRRLPPLPTETIASLADPTEDPPRLDVEAEIPLFDKPDRRSHAWPLAARPN